mmetsp:Transcript_8691/g.12847  ORF Transcript_8691/g.12847 Transcript_8691/m.12847 type:complete len:216 (+) Transcript_8691:1424-2071(+)
MVLIELGEIGYDHYPDLSKIGMPQAIIQGNLQDLFPSTMNDLQNYMYRTKLEFLLSLHIMIISIIYMLGAPLLLLYGLISLDFTFLWVSILILSVISAIGFILLQTGRKLAFNRRLKSINTFLEEKNLDVYGPAGVPMYFKMESLGFPHWKFVCYLQIGRNTLNRTPKTPVKTTLDEEHYNQPLLQNEYVQQEKPQCPPTAPYPVPETDHHPQNE